MNSVVERSAILHNGIRGPNHINSYVEQSAIFFIGTRRPVYINSVVELTAIFYDGIRRPININSFVDRMQFPRRNSKDSIVLGQTTPNEATKTITTIFTMHHKHD